MGVALLFPHCTIVSPDDWLSVPDRGATLPTHEYSNVQMMKWNYVKIQRPTVRWIIALVMDRHIESNEFRITRVHMYSYLTWRKVLGNFFEKIVRGYHFL